MAERIQKDSSPSTLCGRTIWFCRILPGKFSLTYYISKYTHWARFGVDIVIIDLSSNSYYLAEDDVAKTWLQVTKRGSQENLNPAVFKSFIESGLVISEPGSQPVISEPEKATSILAQIPNFRLRAWAMNWHIRRLIKLDRCLKAYKFATEIKLSNKRNTSLLSAIEMFSWAESLLAPTDPTADCLPRSLALVAFLRSLGINAQHKIGGNTVPTFYMHAWVECDGSPVLDDNPDIPTYKIIVDNDLR